MRRLLILRHGETAWNREHRWQGWIDIELTAVGEDQAHERARLLADAGIGPARVVASDLVRARATAAALAASLGAGSVATDPGLRERHGGRWQGCTAAEIDARWPDARQAWRRGALVAPPGGESDAALLDRVLAALDRVVAGTPLGSLAIVVTHGGVLRTLTQHAGAEVHGLPNLGGRWFAWDAGTLHPGEELEPLPSQVRDRPEVE